MKNALPQRALRATRLFDGEQWHSDCGVLLAGDSVQALIPAAAIPAALPCEDIPDGFLAPGLVDLQVNGGGGLLFNNAPSADTVLHIAAAHRRYGTTALLPTLLSDTAAVLEAGVAAVRSARSSAQAEARTVLGIHIEGPFFADARRGTHRADRLRRPSQQDIEWLCSLTDIHCLTTLAPEAMAPGMIRQLAGAGITVSAGHSAASWQELRQAQQEGLRGYTHLFNAMSPLTAREPGVTGAALDSGDCWLSIIADGHHVHPASIRIAQRCAGAGKLFLVSDAMATVGSGQPWFTLYGERITARDGRLLNAEGALAGSAIGLIDAVRYCHQVVGLPLEECLRMASLYPAAFIGEPELGRIAAGSRADLVLLDADLQVNATWLAGQREDHAQPQ
ncbi:N-acetylglucosamine-6-phosphate deacetylase [Haliea sp. E1-2-M8]|uniref:N-acetylglucosamine-6-phosphate deacetylase n=1 Tax=Haliea sp. E1-2-M8 TaxID=3064706 RepID=UPI002722358F|nr:N-acetylglucosamine-6-phosphate deacetylase [Haliea sp. E1-2-M8]MDO8860610.1 N-acetylglucosamine-6-phosphate deacetylase [Haliea sp. E1-2-M8]